jgi:hypothetical protein
MLDDRDDHGSLRAGEVVELRVTSVSQTGSLLARLERELGKSHLRGVPIVRLMRDAGMSV